MQFPDHLERERSLVIKYLIDAITLAYHRLEIFDSQTFALHLEFNVLDRTWKIQGVMSGMEYQKPDGSGEVYRYSIW